MRKPGGVFGHASTDNWLLERLVICHTNHEIKLQPSDIANAVETLNQKIGRYRELTAFPIFATDIVGISIV